MSETGTGTETKVNLIEFTNDNDEEILLDYNKVLAELETQTAVLSDSQARDLVDLYNDYCDDNSYYDSRIFHIYEINDLDWSHLTPLELAKQLRDCNENHLFCEQDNFYSFNNPVTSEYSPLYLPELLDYLIEYDKLDKLEQFGIDLNNQEFIFKPNEPLNLVQLKNFIIENDLIGDWEDINGMNNDEASLDAIKSIATKLKKELHEDFKDITIKVVHGNIVGHEHNSEYELENVYSCERDWIEIEDNKTKKSLILDANVHELAEDLEGNVGFYYPYNRDKIEAFCQPKEDVNGFDLNFKEEFAILKNEHPELVKNINLEEPQVKSKYKCHKTHSLKI